MASICVVFGAVYGGASLLLSVNTTYKEISAQQVELKVSMDEMELKFDTKIDALDAKFDAKI